MTFINGQRVCSRIRGNYYRIPGTCRGIAQIQISSLPGLDYSVELDDGRHIILNEVEIDDVTAEDEEAFQERQERDAEINRKAIARAESKAKARAESEQRKRQQKLDKKQELLDQQARDKQKHDEEMRKEMASIYGAQSLKEVK